MRLLLLALALVGMATAAQAASLDATTLPAALAAAAEKFDGAVGICARHAAGPVCVHGEDRFPMESVAKLLVAVAVLDAVDHQGWRLDEGVTLRGEDASVLVPLPPPPSAAPIATPASVSEASTAPAPAPAPPAPPSATLDNLLSRMVVDSDSAATDYFIRRLGGPSAVQAVVDRLKLDGIRIDRDERHLQTEFLGLDWRPNYIENGALGKAIAELPAGRRQQAFDAFLADPRDTATPAGMAAFLWALQSGQLLSKDSTAHLLRMMKDTAVFPDRLKAGLRPGWSIGHKTGTSATWKGVAAATNDVGLLTAKDGGVIAVAVFIKGSARPAKERAAFIADVARQIVDAYH
jgi:beta-lactamase class A